MAFTILSLPEEVLERILALCIDAQTDAFANPSWHTRLVSRRASSILLVNKTFLRIATPLLYNTVVIRSSHQLTTILDNVFRPNPELPAFVKTVTISGGSYNGLDEFVRLCVNLEEFDMTLDNTPWKEDMREKFTESLMGMKKIKSLVVRKDAYLTQEKPKHLMNQLSNAIAAWTSLVRFLFLTNVYPRINTIGHQESVNIKFRFAPDSTTSPFVSALTTAPNLKTVRAQLPALWNDTLLIISQNPSLRCISLSPDKELVGSHLFLMEARKHDRLMELIKAGTPVMRDRFQSSSSPTSPILTGIPPSPSTERITWEV